MESQSSQDSKLTNQDSSVRVGSIKVLILLILIVYAGLISHIRKEEGLSGSLALKSDQMGGLLMRA